MKRDYKRANAVLAFLVEECGIIMMPWIRKFVREVYATNPDTGLRICSRALLSMGRKGGKTHLIAALFLCHLVGPESHYHANGTRFVSVAGQSKEQASYVYDSMCEIIEGNPAMGAILEIERMVIRHRKTRSYFKHMSANDKGAHGQRSDVWGYDELAQAKDGKLLDALDRAQGNLTEALGFVFSTNSTTPGQPLAELITAVKRGKAEGRMKHWVCHVYAADPEAVDKNPLSMRHIRAANPSYGIILDKERVRIEREEAGSIPSKMTLYRCYRLNINADEHASFCDSHKWRRCGDKTLTIESMKGKECIVAIDLSLSTSLSSVAYWFPDDTDNPSDGGTMIVENWVPDNAIPHLQETHRADYRGWKRAGLIRTTPGSSIELDTIIDRVEEVSDIVNIVDIRRDSARVRELQSKLEQRDSGLQARFVRQGFISLGPASDAFTRLVTGGKLRHNDNPVTNMCLRNTAAKRDPGSTSQQVKPTRLIHDLPIDATVAMVECLMILEKPKPKDDWLFA